MLQYLILLTYLVIYITDGDTITVLDESKNQIRVRLHGIDCPEKGQDYGNVAKEFTADFCKGKSVEVVQTDTDRYGRIVAYVIADKDTLNVALLKSGLAWHYKRYDSNPVWAEYENKARSEKKGLWSMHNPVEPWIWRKK